MTNKKKEQTNNGRTQIKLHLNVKNELESP